MKRVLLLLAMCFTMVPVLAEENVLQTIEVVPVKDTYNIVLVSDKVVDVKKQVQAPNRITLTMKDIRASKTLNTVYNNASNVDTVMVEQQNNGVSIFFQAENAASATVSFDALTPAPVAPIKTEKKLKLNNPIESYAPIYREDLNTNTTSNLFERLKKSEALNAAKDTAEDSGMGEIAHRFFSFGLVTVLIIAVLRLFRKKESDMKIGLTQSLNDREIGLFKGIQPIGQTYPALEKPFTTVNYGINAYKNENKNPYESTPIQLHNQRLRNFAQQPVAEPVAQMAAQPVATATVQVSPKKMTTPINTISVNQSNPNIDNIKFLESMTAIYERSGRHDLARGLQASLSKNHIK